MYLKYVSLPGMKPRQVRPILMRRSTPQPLAQNTPSGGKRRAKRNMQQSAQVILAKQKTNYPKYKHRLSRPSNALY